jgi:hypothetical protein
LHFSQDVMTTHGRVDGGVVGGRGQARCHSRRLCGVESGEMTVSDAGLDPSRPEEVNLGVCH